MSRITIDELLAEARKGLSRVDVESLGREVEGGALLVDIRPEEHRKRDGELPGAIVIDRNVLEWRLAPSSPWRLPVVDHDQPVILVCTEGYASSLAAATLQRLGLRRATDLIGGYQALLACRRGDDRA